MENIDILEKTKSEFILKRLDEVLTYDNQKKTQKIFRELFERLQNYEKELFMRYIDELNAEEANIKEDIYSAGFFDGVLSIIKYFQKS